MKLRLYLALAALAVGLTAAPLSAAPPPVREVVADWAISKNLRALGISENAVPLSGPGSNVVNSDLAFQGDWAFQGTYDGFVIHNVRNSSQPKIVLNYEECAPGGTSAGNQGDLLVWEDLLIRSWNSPASATTPVTCDGEPVPAGFEGLHIFDISDTSDPDLIGSVRIDATSTPAGCGSHTATLVPDVANGNLYVYNSGSSGNCEGIEIVRVPLADPGSATLLRREPTGRACHDTGVILGDAMRAACAGHGGLTVLSMHEEDGGSIEDPVVLWSSDVPGVEIGHSAAFTWDAKYIVFGHEPGGGVQARCQATSSEVDRTIFFFDAATGEVAGSFLHPRPQTATENCTWHNYNVVPTKEKKKPSYVLVSGNYQSGISVVDFSDVDNAKEIAYADPPPLSTTTLITGGDWSSYWYNGTIYESDIRRGLLIWRLNDSRVHPFLRTDHLNPQTQEFTIGFERPAKKVTPGSFELLGHEPLLNRGMNAAIALHGDYAYIGSRTDGSNNNEHQAGVMVVDVSDPTDPTLVRQMLPPFEANVGESSRELRVWKSQEILIVLHTNCGGATAHHCTPPSINNFRFYDISGANASNPQFLFELDDSTHEFFLWEDPSNPERALMFGGSAGSGFTIWDISPVRMGQSPITLFDGTHGFSRFPPFPAPVQIPTGGLHSLSVSNDGSRAFYALLTGGFGIADVSDFSAGMPSPMRRLVTLNEARPTWPGPGAHSALKLWNRDWAYVSDEVYGTITAPGHGCPWGWARMVDISDPQRPTVESEFKLPQNQEFLCDKYEPRPRTSYSAHNPTATPNIVFTTWHSGGLQAISVEDPRIPFQLAEFFPEPLDEVLLEDPRLSSDPDTGLNEKVVMWSYPIIQDGLIYVVDLRNGLYILRYDGRLEDEVNDVTFLEGNSNQGHALCYEPVGAPPAYC
jgi:hypothetical protein